VAVTVNASLLINSKDDSKEERIRMMMISDVSDSLLM
jgi:hypothetical protein